MAIAAAVTASLIVLAGCGGSGSAHPPSTPSPPENYSPLSTGHANITWAALACSSANHAKNCFQGQTSLTQLAGKSGLWGGVEIPDFPGGAGGPFTSRYHCDDADYNIFPPGVVTKYPQSMSQAHAQLRECIKEVHYRMARAVQAARGMVMNQQAVKGQDVIPSGWCKYATNVPQPNAKCAVIYQFGRAMHAVQDFFTHSNWADREYPGVKPGTKKYNGRAVYSTVVNPPGLGQTGLPAIFNFKCRQTAAAIEPDIHASKPQSVSCSPTDTSIPKDLITGCDDTWAKGITGSNCSGRIGHNGAGNGRTADYYGLSKDSGTIDRNNCQGTKPGNLRGRATDPEGVTSFQRAVWGACQETGAMWEQFVAALGDVYGTTQAGKADVALMVQRLTNDP